MYVNEVESHLIFPVNLNFSPLPINIHYTCSTITLIFFFFFYVRIMYTTRTQHVQQYGDGNLLESVLLAAITAFIIYFPMLFVREFEPEIISQT